MGAKNFWLGTTSSNAETPANWSLGLVPVDTDEIIFQSSGNNCTGDLLAAEDVDPDALRVMGTYTGSIGVDASTPFKLADFTATTGVIEIDAAGPVEQAIFLSVTSCPNVIIRSTGSGPNALYFAAGTLTDVFIQGGQNVVFGPSVVIGSGGRIVIEQEADRTFPNVTFLSGFSMNATAELHVRRGYVKNFAALAGRTVVEDGSVFEHLGDATGAMGTLDVSGVARLWTPAAFTCTLGRTFGRGVIDTTRATRGWTFTNAVASGDSEFATRASVDIFTNPPRAIGRARIKAGSIVPLTQM